MTHFLGTHQNRLDAKGRVSVPAPFRTVLKAQNGANGATIGVPLVLRPSHQHPCIEAWPEKAFQALAEPLERLSHFSQEQEDLAAALYADAFPLETDKEGRIVLPDHLVAHAGLTEAVVFMGLGKTFQIWEPERLTIRTTEARQRAQRTGLTLPALGATPRPVGQAAGDVG